MKNWGAYVGLTKASKIRAYLRTNNIIFDEWHDPDGYEFEARVTPEQYSELEAL